MATAIGYTMQNDPKTSRVAHWLRSNRTVLIGILALGLLLRIVHYANIAPTAFPELPRVFTQSDMHAFLEWAQTIQAGDLLGRDTYHPYMEWMKERAPLETWHDWWGGKETFHQAPLYPYFLAGLLTLFGDSLSLALLAQLLVGSLQPLVVYLLARRLFDERVALVSACLSALYGPLVFYQGTLLRDWILPLVEPLFLVALLRADAKGSRSAWLVAGVVAALAFLVKKSILLFVPLALVWILWKSRQNLKAVGRSLLFLLLGFAVGASPLMIRNLTVGVPLLATSNRTAEAFIIGNAADARPVGTHIPDSLVPILEKSGGKTTSVVYHTLMTYEGNLGKIAEKQLHKLRGLVEPLEIPNNLSYDHGCGLSPILRWTLTFSILFPLGMAGFVVSLRAWRRHLPLLLYALAALAGLMVTIILARYRLILVPVLSVYAGSGLLFLVEALRRRQALPVWVYIGLTVIFTLFQQLVAPIGDIRSNSSYVVFPAAYRRSAMVYIREGRFDQALEELKRLRRAAERSGFEELSQYATRLMPNVRVEWAESLLKQGRISEARTQARLAEEAFAGKVYGAEACYRLGIVYVRLGERVKASKYLQTFLRMAPEDKRAGAVRKLQEQLKTRE